MDTNKINKMNTITTDIKRAIINAHRSAEYSTHTARGGMERAINDRIKCAALVEKAKAINKDINGLLSDTELTAQQIKAYLSLHDAAKKRPAMNDKRQLLLCGILETAEMPAENTDQAKSTPKPTVISSASSFMGKFNKIISRRPVSEWGEAEKQQIKDVIEPIKELWEQL